MIQSKGFHYCDACESKRPHSALVSIGEKVFVPGESRTEYTFFQCSRCGHVWQHIEDSGLGGHASFYSLLTKP